MPTIQERIQKYATEPNKAGCILWKGALANGRPALRVDGLTLKVSRIVLSNKLGRELLETEHALHSCDVATCINADHLHAGSHADNMREMWERKPPRRRGEGVGKAKLTSQQVAEIRSSSETLRALASRYGVVPSTIFVIKSRKTWAQVA